MLSFQGTLTMKVSSDMIHKMHQEAEKVWIPELAKLMKETKDPFINFIYDSDPLEKISWGNVVLVGDAAHPTTPHCIGSTNMSILDAAVLGKCLEKWGAEKLESALEEYQSIRLPVTSKQVLHARRLGRIKQGLVLPDRDPFDPMSVRPGDFVDEHTFSQRCSFAICFNCTTLYLIACYSELLLLNRKVVSYSPSMQLNYLYTEKVSPITNLIQPLFFKSYLICT